eukprot:gnl/Hemi2/22360_TR7445_c0_g1_i1.p1 gnl/Hemi2/22360_TR7445_c0_g1~~gnl/Hemi2/22360_TR7445_c0_g1_i1.p1  ORF type:complete len:112 (+),score=32.58 gnl/Hemi2/22360_TR7445_c0_g1_i1:145-480(+)
MSKRLAFLALAGALLFATNPSKESFASFYNGLSSANTSLLEGLANRGAFWLQSQAGMVNISSLGLFSVARVGTPAVVKQRPVTLQSCFVGVLGHWFELPMRFVPELLAFVA